MVSPPTSVAAYLRATQRILALVVQVVAARMDLWTVGVRALDTARTAMAAVTSEHVRAMPSDSDTEVLGLANTVSYNDVLGLAMDADDIKYSCHPLNGSRPPAVNVHAVPEP